MKRILKFKLLASALALSMANYDNNEAEFSAYFSTFKRKCLHPDCDKETTHNGGHCSAECCKAHRLLMKNKNQGTK